MATPNLGISATAAILDPNTAPTVQVRPAAQATAQDWDQFVLRQPQGTFFHLMGWQRALAKTFGYESCSLQAERAGRIAGVLPLFRIKNWVMGECLMSTPFAVYGGICAEDKESAEALLREATRHAREGQVEHLELRHRRGGIQPGFHHNSLYSVFTTEILPSEEGNFKRLPRDTRYMIRKGQKSGLSTRSGLEQLDQFYGLFARNMQRHGTPVFPRAWLSNLIEEFSGQVELMMVYQGAEAVTGVLSFRFRDCILPYYAGVTDRANALGANNFMYWELIRQAAAGGLRWFDFGRSKKGTGAYKFKTTWSMLEETLDYQVYLVKRQTVPNFSPLNPKVQLATRMWQRLPLWATTRMGPHIVRWFP